jgi:hypothetical protein
VDVHVVLIDVWQGVKCFFHTCQGKSVCFLVRFVLGLPVELVKLAYILKRHNVNSVRRLLFHGNYQRSSLRCFLFKRVLVPSVVWPVLVGECKTSF